MSEVNMGTLHRNFRAESGDSAKWDRDAATWFVAHNGKAHGVTERFDIAIEDIMSGQEIARELGLDGFDFPTLMRLGRARREGQVK
jgi:hypothetical protein